MGLDDYDGLPIVPTYAQERRMREEAAEIAKRNREARQLEWEMQSWEKTITGIPIRPGSETAAERQDRLDWEWKHRISLRGY